MKFREVFLLILLIGAGLVIYQVQTGRWDLSFHWDEDFIGLGREYAYETSEVFDGPLPGLIEVVNGHGWVVIEGTDGDAARLTFRKRIWRKNEEDANEVAAQLKHTVVRTDERLALSTNREEFRRRNFETGFILAVPRGTAVRVENAHGDVRISDVRDVAVENRHGRVDLARIEGDCSVENSYDAVDVANAGGECRILTRHSEVRAFSVTGGLWIENRHGRIRVEDAGRDVVIRAGHTEIRGRRIRGAVDIETSYEEVIIGEVGPAKIRARHAPVDADWVEGDLDVQTSYDRVKAANVKGGLSVTGNNVGVTAREVGGEILIDTSYEKVDIAGFSGRTTVKVRNGDVVLRPAALGFPVNVAVEYGHIRFYWPAGEEAPVEASSRGGDVVWGVESEPSVRQTNGTTLVKAFQQRTDRPPVVLSTTYRDIRIEEAPRDF